MIEKERLHPDDQANWHGWVSYICGKWEISRRFKVDTILEIGVRTGYAAWAFLQAHPKAKYIGLDNYSYGNYPDWAKENLLKDYNIDIIKGDTQTDQFIKLFGFKHNSGWDDPSKIDLASLYKGPYTAAYTLNLAMRKVNFSKFDLIHVDGDHTRTGVMHDLDLSIAALAPRGVILIDDYDRIPDVRAGVNEWLSANKEMCYMYVPSFTGDIIISRTPLWSSSSTSSTGGGSTDLTIKPKGKLLVFHHGLGDLLLFMPLYNHLKKQGEYGLALQAGCDFKPLVKGSHETPAGDFDYDAFCRDHGYDSYQVVAFAMGEGSGKTKTEYCAEREFGITDFSFSCLVCEENWKGIIGVNFHGTCLPGMTNPDYEIAKKIWGEIKEAGYIPLEIYFEHVFHNPVNDKFDFVDNTTRGMIPDVEMLMRMLESCYRFVGVASGVWVAALTKLSKDKICCLEKAYSAADYIPGYSKENIIDINNYQDGAVKKWLAMRS